MDIIKEKWEEIKNIIKEEYSLTDISYNTWIMPLKYKSKNGNIINISIPADQAPALNYIERKYKSYFIVTISEMIDEVVDINFILDSDDELTPINNNEEKEINTDHLNNNLNNKYKFDTFVVGNNNRLAYSAALAVAESPGVTYNPLFIYGGPGLGKTHLMHSIGHYILENNPNTKVLYITSEEFTNEVIDSIRSGDSTSINKLRDKYRTVDVLMVDDVQFIIGKERTQEEFFHTFNVLKNANKQIVLSSDKPPIQMETLEERFRSRFEWGLTTDIQSPDYETRVAILKKNADFFEKDIDEEIITYIAKNIKSNIRELEGAFNKIIAYARLNKVDLTISLAEEILKDIINPDVKREITPEIIIATVAEHYNVKPEDITSKKRNADFVLPRQMVMYLCRELTDISFKNIGLLLGKKDHTTVIYGYNKMVDEIKYSEEMEKKVDILKKKLSQ